MCLNSPNLVLSSWRFPAEPLTFSACWKPEKIQILLWAKNSTRSSNRVDKIVVRYTDIMHKVFLLDLLLSGLPLEGASKFLNKCVNSLSVSWFQIQLDWESKSATTQYTSEYFLRQFILSKPLRLIRQSTLVSAWTAGSQGSRESHQHLVGIAEGRCGGFHVRSEGLRHLYHSPENRNRDTNGLVILNQMCSVHI